MAAPCDLVITDIMMPKLSGYDVCREIRKISMIPVFMISANNDEIDRVLGLELGSDDYISKPISFRELNARIHNTFRRMDMANEAEGGADGVIVCGNLTLAKQAREVLIDGKLLKTTTKEFDLLLLFLENKKIAFSRETIIERVWGYDYYGDSRQVDHMIKRLRKKMLESLSTCQIETVWGYGYKIGETDEA